MDDEYSGMIAEDHRAPANLPQDVVHKYYPSRRYMDKYTLEDSLVGATNNINDSVDKLNENQSDSMY